MNPQRDLLDIFERVLSKGVLIEAAEAADIQEPSRSRMPAARRAVNKAEVNEAWRHCFYEEDKRSH